MLFLLKNNDLRSYGFAGKLCIAGSGNPTPPEAAKQVINGQPFRLPPLFEMSPEDMFKSFRGVLAAMKITTRQGKPAIEVFVDGVASALTEQDIQDWAAEYRRNHGLPEPTKRAEHMMEVERAMARPDDPLEVRRRNERDQEQARLVELVTMSVLHAMRAAPAAPAPPAPPAAGRNDEKPEDPAPQGRARPR